jgi:putative hydrolase of the HAD superfamily
VEVLGGVRYDAVFLDVDGTMLWMDLDLEGYVEDLAPYAAGELTPHRAARPVQEALREYIQENVRYRTVEELNGFKHANARRTARLLGLDAPPEVLLESLERRLSFNLFPETVEVLEELRKTGAGLYVVSNWDILLEDVLEEMGILGYFDGLIVSALVGAEKPDRRIFREALRVSRTDPRRAVHVGNDPVADVRGAAACGIDAVLVDRSGEVEAPEAVATIPDLGRLPELVGS